MKNRLKLGLTMIIVLVLALLAGGGVGAEPTEVLLDSVNIGDTTDEDGHNLAGWTDVWSGCGWCGADGNMRLIWGNGGESSAGENNWASVTLDTGDAWPTKLVVDHLDGQADDGFEVYINGDFVGAYEDKYESNTWVPNTEFSIPSKAYYGLLTIKFVATGEGWSGIGTYGQVAFNDIELMGEQWTWIDFVNVGTPESEDEKLLGSWGPIEPDEHGGNWGHMGSGTCGIDHFGFTPTGALCDGKTRVIWEQGVMVDGFYMSGSRAAMVEFANPGGTDNLYLIVRYLDGLADDSFSIQVRGENKKGKANTKWYTLAVMVDGEEDGIEDWHIAIFDLSTDFKGEPIPLGDPLTIKFRAEGDAWASHQTYGQVAIDWVGLAP